MSLASLHTIGTSLATTSTTFDPTVQGMTRGGTVYFTAKAVLNTGEESALSPAYSWVVPPATPPPAVLTAVTVSGPSSVNEGGTGTYTATGTWDNGTTAAISPTWSENSSYATISSGGVLTASAVTSNQAVTVTATYGGLTGTRSVTIVDVPAVLTAVTVSGPSSVNEGGTGTYTATGTWDNGTTAAISPTWSENSSYATISSGGVLTASAVTSNQAVTVTATYGGLTGTRSVTIVDVPAVLTAVTVSGPSSVNEGGTGTYTATGTWDNGTTAAISPTWSENSSYATISSGGVLTASAVTSNQAVTVTASYGGLTGTRSVTIVDVAAVLTSIDGERPVVGERGRDRYVHGDGDVGQRDDGGDQPDVERELVVRDDQLRRRADGVRGDVEPGGDGDGDLRRVDRHEERDDRRRAGATAPGGARRISGSRVRFHRGPRSCGDSTGTRSRPTRMVRPSTRGEPSATRRTGPTTRRSPPGRCGNWLRRYPANMVDFDPLAYPMVKNQADLPDRPEHPRHGRAVVSCGQHRVGRGERRSRPRRRAGRSSRSREGQ